MRISVSRRDRRRVFALSVDQREFVACEEEGGNDVLFKLSKLKSTGSKAGESSTISERSRR